MLPLLIFLFIILISCSSAPFSPTIIIAWSGPLTGEFKELGTDNLRGVMIAVDEINTVGGVVRGDGVRVRLEVRSGDVGEEVEGDVVVRFFVDEDGLYSVLSQGSRSVEIPVLTRSSLERKEVDQVWQTYERLYQSVPKNAAVVSSGYESVQMLAKRIVVARSREKIVGFAI